jgi:hypothetical protein
MNLITFVCFTLYSTSSAKRCCWLKAKGAYCYVLGCEKIDIFRGFCRFRVIKSIVQRILREIDSWLLLYWRQFFTLNFKWTPSQEEHKTIFSGLR